MNRFATSILALALAGAGSTALAEQTKDQISTQTTKPQPVQMTDAQLDNVAGGLIDVIVANNDVRVAIPVNAQVAVNAAAAVSVLGGAVAGAAQQLGNQTQRVFQP